MLIREGFSCSRIILVLAILQEFASIQKCHVHSFLDFDEAARCVAFIPLAKLDGGWYKVFVLCARESQDIFAWPKDKSIVSSMVVDFLHLFLKLVLLFVFYELSAH